MSLSSLRPAFRRHLQNSVLRRQCPQCRTHSRIGTSTSTHHGQESVPAAASNAIPLSTGTATATATSQLSIFQRLGPLTRAAEAYGRAHRKRPYLVQLASSLVIYLAGDVLAQSMDDNEFDYKRTGRSLLIGGLGAIPSYTWFVFLSKQFNYSSKILSLGLKVIVNQVFFSLTFNTYFFSAQALLSGSDINGAVERVKQTLIPSWINSWKLWPAVTVVSFAFIPLEYRSLFGGVIAIGWQAYLNYLNKIAAAKNVAVEGIRPALKMSIPDTSSRIAMAA